MEKKMLVSDYDGTLFSDLGNLYINIYAIKEFREKGNLFVISTGRSYDSIKGEIELHQIPYDYVMCYNGLVLFDNEGNLLNSHEMDKEHIKGITELVKEDFSIEKYGYYGPYSAVEAKNNEEIDSTPIVEIHLRKRMLKDIRDSLSFFKSEYPSVSYSKFGRDYYLKEDYSKKDGIDFLIDMLDGEVKKENVVTVGDSSNDIEMLQGYNGYKVFPSNPCLYGKGIKNTREVHTLIKKMSK